GDVVRMTPEGYLEVQGRAGDHINRAGEKISAEEIEDHLLSHPQVFDAAVVSVPDEYLRARSCAFVIPKGERPRPADLKRWIRARDQLSAAASEAHLLWQPQVVDAAGVSVPDEYRGERSCAFVTPKGERPRPAALKRWIRARGSADFKVPDQVVFGERFAST